MAGCDHIEGLPTTERRRLKLAGYVERRPGTWMRTGISCMTCPYFDDFGACVHPKVRAEVVGNGCCNYWAGEACKP